MGRDGSITLHPKLGLNVHMTVCPRCCQNGDELVLLGIHNRVYECAASDCKARTLGKKEKKCPGCGYETERVFVREIGEHERVSGSVCGACQKELKEHQDVVEAGGIVFKCADCKAEGVIKASAPLAKMVRETHQKQGGKGLVKGWFTEPIHTKGNDHVYVGCGVEFTKADCPQCGPKEK